MTNYCSELIRTTKNCEKKKDKIWFLWYDTERLDLIQLLTLLFNISIFKKKGEIIKLFFMIDMGIKCLCTGILTKYSLLSRLRYIDLNQAILI